MIQHIYVVGVEPHVNQLSNVYVSNVQKRHQEKDSNSLRYDPTFYALHLHWRVYVACLSMDTKQIPPFA